MTNDLRRAPNRENASKWLLLAARLCFAAAIILIPVRYRIVLAARPIRTVPKDYTDLLLFAADIAVLLMLGLWLISLAISPHRLSLGPRYIWIPLAGITIAGWASTIVSFDPLLSVYHAIRFTVLFWFYMFIVNELRFVGWVAIPIGIQIMVQSVIGLAQFIAQGSVGLEALGEYYLNPAQKGVSVVVANGSRLLRAHGLTDHPNILGGCLAFGLVVILAAYLHARTRSLALAVLLPAISALLVSFSRSAWLAFIFGATVLLVVEFLNHRQESVRPLLWLGLAEVFLIAPFLLAYPQFFGVRLNAGNSFSTPSVEQQSIGERLLLMKSYISILKEHPWLGVGLGAAPLALRAHHPGPPVNPEPAHVALLDAAVELGLPSSAFYLILMACPFVIYFLRRGSLMADPLATAAIALLVAITVVGLFDHYTWTMDAGRLWQWLAWGLWAIVSSPEAAVSRVLAKSHPLESIQPRNLLSTDHEC